MRESQIYVTLLLDGRVLIRQRTETIEVEVGMLRELIGLLTEAYDGDTAGGQQILREGACSTQDASSS